MKKIGSLTPSKVVKIEPLAVQCKMCMRRKSHDSIVSIECGHPTKTCRRCFRMEVKNLERFFFFFFFFLKKKKRF